MLNSARVKRALKLSWLIWPVLAACLVFASPTERFDDDLDMIHPTRVDERLSVTKSYYYNSGSVSYYSNRHALQMQFKYMGSGESVTTGGVSGVMSTTGGGTGSTNGTGGIEYYLHVSSGGEMSAPADPFAHGADGNLPAGIVHKIIPGGVVTANLSAATVLSGGTITVTIEAYFPGVEENTETPEIEYVPASSDFAKTTYTITKIVCNDAAIDSRRINGQPNVDGEIPGSSQNAPAKNANFGNWTWRKSGLFAGHARWLTDNDFSGTARVQLYPQSATGYSPVCATLTMFHQGPPAGKLTGDVKLGAFVPLANDPNYDPITTEANVTWENKWNILPQDPPGGTLDDSKDPLYRIDFDSTGSGQYANWPLTKRHVSSGVTFNARALQAICIAIHDEADWISNTNNAAWRYFASKEWQNLDIHTSTFPANDSAPRLWIVTAGSTTTWSKTWSTWYHSWGS